MDKKELPVFIEWENFINWLLSTTEKFPKQVRFTFSTRLDNMSLDIMEKIIEAKYSSEKLQLLKQINLDLEKMRILMRLCHRRRFLADRSYQYAVKHLQKTGAMIGGWIKQQQLKYG